MQDPRIIGWVQNDFAAFSGKTVKLVRCYSMAQSGNNGTAAGFHSACDGNGPTVTVVKTKEGFVFGGAADKSWGSKRDNQHIAFDSAFLFCIKCAGAAPHAAPSQLKLTGQTNGHTSSQARGEANNLAMYYSSGNGPTFGLGYGHDLKIGTTPGETRTVSHTALRSIYTCPAGTHNTAACNSYLAGKFYFTVADYEVFVIRAV